MSPKARSYKLSRGRKGASVRAARKKSAEQRRQEKEDQRWLDLAQDTVRMASMQMDLLGE